VAGLWSLLRHVADRFAPRTGWYSFYARTHSRFTRYDSGRSALLFYWQALRRENAVCVGGGGVFGGGES